VAKRLAGAGFGFLDVRRLISRSAESSPSAPSNVSFAGLARRRPVAVFRTGYQHQDVAPPPVSLPAQAPAFIAWNAAAADLPPRRSEVFFEYRSQCTIVIMVQLRL